VIPTAIPVSEATVPIIAPPNPRHGGGSHSSQSHNRGRSSVDNTMGGRISRATERMRSASRSRASAAQQHHQQQQNDMMMMHGGAAPYESIPPPPQVSVNYRLQNQVVLQQVQAQVAQQEGRNEFRTGLHQSEMI
jgi:hypothetical protein